jgi:hypothetical protein
MAGAFAVLWVWPWIRHGHSLRWWAFGLALAFLILALAAPAWLAPLNRLWFKFGLVLQKVVSPIIMGLLFFGAVLPVGLIVRLRGKDPLRLKRSDEPTYWIAREPPGPAPNSMSKQF